MSVFAETILERPLEEVLPEAFVAYSKHVIRDRAIADVRDGLKPVHRRIIYTMYRLGMTPDKPYSKSARMVGDCMAKYHPHGDTAIYDAGVRLAQPWATRYLMVDGHGNFGSIDGDNAAAMRYTEMRMTNLALLMCADIEKETVKFVLNYDAKEEEPVVLPAPTPYVLVNGGAGIAVGMASNMPPHNLREVIDGLILQIDNPDLTADQLMAKVKGPDFPTGGFIVGIDGIREAYLTGRGKVAMRARVNMEAGKNGKTLLVVSEIPYQVNKASLAARIEALSEDKIEGINDVRDESDREGLRLVVELKKDVDPRRVLSLLYKYTDLQSNFSIINLVIAGNGTPQVLGLKQINAAFIQHRREVVTRRTEYDLAKAKARAHILEGLVKAINNLDEVIAVIRAAKTPAIAKANLIVRFEFSEIQAQAILDMKLQHLTGMELEAIKKEYADIIKLIGMLEEILADVQKVFAIIKKELKEIADKFGDDRRTIILPADADDADMLDTPVNMEAPEKAVEIVLTKEGFIKQIPPVKRAKNGLAVMFKDGDTVCDRLACTDRDTLYFFSRTGRFYSIGAKVVPEAGLKEKGRAITNLFPLPENEQIISMVAVREAEEDLWFVFLTRNGQVLRSPVPDFLHARSPEAIGLKDDDELRRVFVSNGEGDLLVTTRYGMCIRFPLMEVPAQGRKSQGVRGMSLDTGDQVVGGLVLDDQARDIITVAERGFIKRTSGSEYKPQGRGGKGIAIAKIDLNKTGYFVAAAEAGDGDIIHVVQKSGALTQMDVGNLKMEGRAKTGTALVSVMMDDYVEGVIK